MVQEDQEHGINVNSNEEPMVDITVGIQKKWPCSESESKMYGGASNRLLLRLNSYKLN